MTSREDGRPAAGGPAIPVAPGSVVVSCQAPVGSPLRSAPMMAAMASAAQLGGAAAIRANGVEDVAAIVAATGLPTIGLDKAGVRSGVNITPTFEAARAVIEAGAAMVALDGTNRPRPNGETLASIIRRIHDLGVPVLADCDGLASAEFAVESGCDAVATTLVGYTSGAPVPDEPDLDAISAFRSLGLPVFAEGRVQTQQHVERAFDAGAYAVVVGGAVTNPTLITQRLVTAGRRA